MSNGVYLCIAALLLTVFAARRSLSWGISAVLLVGYAYGILRANFPDGASHFIFDASLVGLYAVEFSKEVSVRTAEASVDAKRWLTVLMGWPIILFALPFHHYLIQLVGLRHIILFMPALLIGARCRAATLERLTYTIGALNLAAFGFALYEYRYGMPSLYPRNSVTELMYHSYDIRTAEGTYFRIPATFSSSHSYAGTMVQGMPFLWNFVRDSSRAFPKRVVAVAVMIITVLGIFIAGPRGPVVALGVWAVFMLILPGIRAAQKLGLAVAIFAIGLLCAYYIVSNQRMQRFTSLANLEMVEARTTQTGGISLSTALTEYPIGVGLGGAIGASIPYFLKHLAPEPIGAENEYVRIAVEQGAVGFFLWVLFIIRLVRKRPTPVSENWIAGTHAVWALVLMNFATTFIGTGLLQSIPLSFLLFVELGLLLRVHKEKETEASPVPARRNRFASARTTAPDRLRTPPVLNE